MNIKSIFSVMVLFAGFLSVSANAELIASATYTKPGCHWQFMEGGWTGNPNDYTHRYEIFALSCSGQYVASKTNVLRQNVVQTCHIALVNSTSYTLTSSSCTAYQIHTSATSSSSSSSAGAPGTCPNSGIVITTICANSLSSQGAQQFIAEQCGACGATYTNLGGQAPCHQQNPLIRVTCK